jgi:hypothetical protein
LRQGQGKEINLFGGELVGAGRPSSFDDCGTGIGDEVLSQLHLRSQQLKHALHVSVRHRSTFRATQQQQSSSVEAREAKGERSG